MKDVAVLAGVSTATVSRVLNEDPRVAAPTRGRVTAAARQLGYVRDFSASSLASGRHRSVGVLVPAVDRWYFSTILEGITGSLLGEGYDATLYNSGGGTHNRALFDDFLLRRRTDAVIVIGSKLDADEVDRLLAVGKPLVVVGRSLPGISTIETGDFDAAAAATRHLIDLGHQGIAHIGEHDGNGPNLDMFRRRHGGYRWAMRQAGLRVSDRWTVHSDVTVAGGCRAARSLLLLPEQERPSAIFCSSDEMAVGAILAAKELGLTVPGDLSVIGIDGNELGAPFGLTTVNQFAKEQGQRAVQQLLSQLTASQIEEAPTREVISIELVVRTSTSAPAVEP